MSHSPDEASTFTPPRTAVRRSPPARRTGRRPGESLSREAILQAARELFADQGFAGTTVRAIARKASVDPALVHYFFANKEGVYEAVVEDAIHLMDALASVFDGGSEQFAERLVPAYLELWEGENGGSLAAMYRTAMARGPEDPVAARLQPDRIIDRMAAAMGGRGARLRAALILSLLHGVVVERHVLKLDPLATANLKQVARWLTPSVQALVNP
ncbi:TetR family transcriptional regulator [Streptomyces sp. URMC 129]|uniref:TetR/AcrR family transcriptional regulator n=1 Tax=Streptomyces sp. URMC 129 TaxID=3423407 RepID=UPI003F1BE95D